MTCKIWLLISVFVAVCLGSCLFQGNREEPRFGAVIIFLEGPSRLICDHVDGESLVYEYSGSNVHFFTVVTPLSCRIDAGTVKNVKFSW